MKNVFTETMEITREVSVEPFYKDLVRATETITKKFNGMVSSEYNTVITTLENVEAAKGNNKLSYTIPVPNMHENKAVVAMISNKNWDELMNGNLHITDVIEKYSDLLYKNNKNNYHIVLWDIHAYIIATLDKEIIPIPIYIDYINGHTDDVHYDLTKLEEVLAENKKSIVKYNGICYIPYYNCFDGRQKYIDFYFLPSKEVYTEGIKKNCLNRVEYMLEQTFDMSRAKII